MVAQCDRVMRTSMGRTIRSGYGPEFEASVNLDALSSTYIGMEHDGFELWETAELVGVPVAHHGKVQRPYWPQDRRWSLSLEPPPSSCITAAVFEDDSHWWQPGLLAPRAHTVDERRAPHVGPFVDGEAVPKRHHQVRARGEGNSRPAADKIRVEAR